MTWGPEDGFVKPEPGAIIPTISLEFREGIPVVVIPHEVVEDSNPTPASIFQSGRMSHCQCEDGGSNPSTSKHMGLLLPPGCNPGP